MSVALVIGTKKGAAILKSADRKSWSQDFALKGWAVTASVRDDQGRVYAAVMHDVYGPSILASDDLDNWRQLEATPRYKAGEKGNAEHIRIVASGDFMAATRTARASSIISGRCTSHTGLSMPASRKRDCLRAATAASPGSLSTASTIIPRATRGFPASVDWARTPS